ncbi:hypothetical protein JHK85_010460 [Glycine max]|nr:hypothetical protein JHK85_010460 [Glycine max]
MEIDEAIQAWLTMEMQHVVNLERDIEFPRLALPNRRSTMGHFAQKPMMVDE